MEVLHQSSSQTTYAMHPFFLTFVDDEVENRYKHFAYVTSGFYGGKLWHLLALAINLLFYVYYHGISQGFNANMFIGPFWVGLLVNTVATIGMGVGLFVESLYEYREVFFLVSLATHWPAYTLLTFFGMASDWPFRYLFVVGCLFFCTFVVQARFSRCFWFLTISPLLTLIISTTLIPSYWDGMSYLEIALWLLLLYPPATLRMFERQSRKCFLKMERSERMIEDVNHRIERTQDLIANFFAKTPTKDFLSEGKKVTRSRNYPDTSMIVTDLAGFTAWTSKTEPTVVIKLLSEMFNKMDELSLDFDVEKVSTVGDCFMGAVFPSEVDFSVRVSNAAKFSTLILNSGGELKLRIGLHVGPVTAGFVGNRPPKFDLFGESFETAKNMESGGIPGKVHASTHALAIAGGQPTDAEATPFGAAFTTWDSPEVLDESASQIEFFTTMEVYNICQALIKIGKQTVGNTTADTQLRGSSVLPVQYSSADFGTQQSSSIMDHSFEADSAPIVLVEQPSCEIPSRTTPQTTFLQAATGSENELPQFAPFEKRNDDAVVTSVSSIPSVGSLAERDALPGAIATVEHGELPPKPKSSRGFLSMNPKIPSMKISRRNSGVREHSTKYAAPSISSNSAVSSIASKYSFAGDESDVAMNPFLLEFDDSENEQRFKIYLKRTGLVFKTSVVILSLELVMLLALLLLACVDSVRNRLLLTSMMLLFTSLALAILLKMPVRSSVSLGCFACISFLGVFLDHQCNDTARFYTSAVVMGLFQNNILLTQFMLENKLVVRLGMNVCCCILGQTAVILRNFVVHADVPWGPVWLVGILGLGFVSYFSDYTLRSAFAAEQLLSIVHRRMKGKHHETARAAMDVMLPGFVSQKLLGRTTTTASCNVSESDETEDEPDVVRSGSKSKLWNFPHVCVMFVSFSPEAASVEEQLETINETLDDVEAILKAGNIHKIKTIGSTLLCVAGINNERDAVEMSAKAAIEIVRKAFFAKPNWKFSIGINSGGCFGAVLGSKSLIFDVFGDTVNMASRMATTATPRTIQVSEQMFKHCEANFEFVENEPVFVKGKGMVKTYQLRV